MGRFWMFRSKFFGKKEEDATTDKYEAPQFVDAALALAFETQRKRNLSDDRGEAFWRAGEVDMDELKEHYRQWVERRVATTAVVNAGIIDATPVTATPVTAAPVVVAPVIAEDDKIEDIMSEGNKGTMRLYDVETGKLMKTYPPMA